MHSVLIVGAGPTGLMMACELARYGISFRIIDKKAEPTATTNAAGIHARTLEIFEHIGIVQQFLAAGNVADCLEVNSKNTILVRVPLNTVDSHFKFVLLLPQSVTEKILNEHLQELNHQVERMVELTELKLEDDKVISTVKHPDGHLETIETEWVIGCDGYHSTVREKSQIEMHGSDIREAFFVTDARVKTKSSSNVIEAFFSKGTVVALFPLPDETGKNDKFRVVANMKSIEAKKTFTEEEIRSIIHDHTDGQCEVSEIIWSSHFWIHSKMASSLRKERIFIAGDAAHVHSPAGAQGMNTGIQDVYNLAWKLALVINKKANSNFLESYQQERYPIIHTIVNATYRMSRLALTTNPILIAIRNFFIRNITGRSESIKKIMVKYIAQLGWNYRKSPIVDKETLTRHFMLQPGDLIVDVALEDKKHLFDFLNNTQHNLLLFSGPSPSPETQKNIAATYQWVTQNTDNLIKVYVVSNDKIELPNIINDVGLAIHRRYNVTKPSMCLVRPDHYIGLFKEEMTYLTLKKYFDRVGLHFG
ncbi:FAD-dependent monooxygenase [Legionella micdadei]|uniref:2-polyprenyl-6-methoxyphenol hydroxylase n=1 Tax=Legionella micdadei TaxID=451 RepID=A0A098GAK8_LEGMI|nr:FAD-dependent monooxygenase [Legionella micdadei]ARG96279.1 hypothetical protein B6N58_00440 [Legionella micdadei]KTD29097.1 FAD dependent oxidoreductase [Legionella micdadei]CEG59463.1 putative Monooxygenase FAD-binding protein [Legionella micdadei]SCX90646.1 2-polyprenyl-6-methoxyphenol hydroxylase [Legionella micdadei]